MKEAYMHPREQIVTIMRRVYGYGMTTTSGGNLSIKDATGDIWITPAGVDKGGLTEDDIICMRGEAIVEGKHKPSSEYPFHRAIYGARSDVRAVLHAHPSALVAFSLVHKIPDTAILPQAQSVCGPVGYADYAIPGSEELGRNLAQAFARGHDTVLLENHGVATCGKSLLEAFQRFETLDFCARTLVLAGPLGPAKVLTREQIALSHNKKNIEMPEFAVVDRGSTELSLRRRIVDTVHRAYRQRLMTSTEGTISCRVGPDSFLITPFGVDRMYLDVEDMVLIERGRRETGKLPSRAVQLHQAIYQASPDLGAVVSAQSPGVMAFCVTGNKLDTRTIPESSIVLRDVKLFSFGIQFDEKALAREIREESPVVFVENEAALVVGKDLTAAFDRLEVAEFSAQAVINARNLGEIVSIGDRALRDIEEKFQLKKVVPQTE